MVALSTHELFSSGFLNDPYPTFARLREEAPVYWVDAFRVFAVTRYDDCVNVLMHPEQFGPGQHIDPSVGGIEPAREPAEHIRYRNLIARAFTTEFVAHMRASVQSLVDSFIDRFTGPGEVDVMPALARPLPTLVLAELLGIPEEQRSTFYAWAEVYTGSLSGPVDMEKKDRFLQTMQELVSYFAYLIEQRRGGSGNDLVTRLTAAYVGEERLSAAQILSFCEQLMVAGRDLTSGLIGNCLQALLSHPRELERLRAQPDLLDAAIEETLRWDTPVLGQPRTSRFDTELRGVRIRAGDQLIVMFGAANRDPNIFPLPDAFDIQRTNAGQHLAFGKGIHYCVGAQLARLEARVAISTLFARLPGLRLAAERQSERRFTEFMLNLRTFGSVPVIFNSA